MWVVRIAKLCTVAFILIIALSYAVDITFVPPSDANNSFVNRNYTFINVTVSEIDSCTLEWNSTNYTMTKGSGNCYLNRTDSDGTYTYRIYANDSAGNINSTQRTITFDTVLPSASINFSGGYNNTFSPNSDNIYDEIIFNVTASETVNFSTTYLLAANGSRVKTFNEVDNTKSILKTWNGCFIQACSTGFAPEGNYSIEIRMTDRAGNVNATNLTIKIILDNTSLQILFASPTPNNATINDSNSVFVNITTSETPHSAVLEWNGTNETMDGNVTGWFKTKTNLADGNYTFRVYANDSVGNRNISETRWVFINATRNMSSVINNISQSLSSSNITVTILNSSGNPANSSQLLSFANYTLRFNASSILVETADFLVGSLNVSAVPNITRTITAELNVSVAFNESGGVLDNYVWVDLNNLLLGNFTAKIIFPRIYALYFYLNGTKDAPNITRANACNTNLTNTPCYNISANKSVLYLPSFSGGAGGNDTKAPVLSVSSPIMATYTSSSVSLTYTVSDNVAIDKCWYNLNGINTTLDSCANSTIIAATGSNTLVVYANDTSNNMNQTSITFTYTPSPTPPQTSTTSGGTGTDDPAKPKTQTNVANSVNVKEPYNIAQTNITSPINRTGKVVNNETVGGARNKSLDITGFATVSTASLIIGAFIAGAVGGIIFWKFANKRLRAKRRSN